MAIKTIFTLNERHKTSLIKLTLCFDIEENPGPIQKNGTKLVIVTLNCRGLGNVDKFRLVLNKANQILKENPNAIIMLQEIMVKDDKYLKLSWRGSYAITYGTGNSQGCLTLARSNIILSNQVNIDNSGHKVEAEGLLDEKTTILNIYAPNGYGNDKKRFFDEVLDIIENSTNRNTILAGDFNLTFSEADRYKRNTCTGEKNIAKTVSDRLINLNMADAWAGSEGMTWKRSNTM